MASLTQDSRARSPFWICCYTSATGQRLKKSTKIRIKPLKGEKRKDGSPKTVADKKREAWEVCLGIERTESHAKNGTLTEQQAKKIIGEILERTTGEPLHNYKVRALARHERAGALGENDGSLSPGGSRLHGIAWQPRKSCAGAYHAERSSHVSQFDRCGEEDRTHSESFCESCECRVQCSSSTTHRRKQSCGRPGKPASNSGRKGDVHFRASVKARAHSRGRLAGGNPAWLLHRGAAWRRGEHAMGRYRLAEQDHPLHASQNEEAGNTSITSTA
jgi:hypothetical protein